MHKKTTVSIAIFLLFGVLVAWAALGTLKKHRWEYAGRKNTNLSEKMVGIYLEDLSDLDTYEELPDIVAWFEDWYQQPAYEKLREIGRNNFALPLITWQPDNIPLEEIAEGKHDKYIREYLTTVSDSCPDSEILIRFAHEMEMSPDYAAPWYSWQGKDPEIYIAAWKKVVSIGREISPRIRWIWSPNRATEYGDAYYPGSEWVDYVGITINKTRNRRFQDFGEYYETCGRFFLEQYKKKIILGEIAYSPFYEENQTKQRCEYIEGIFNYFMQDPLLEAVVFFDEDVTDTRQFCFMDIPECRSVWFEGIRKLRKEAE